MSYLRRADKKLTDKPSPLLKVFRSSEMHVMVIDGLPSHHQGIAGRLLNRLQELQTITSSRSLKKRNGESHAVLESGFHAGFDL